MEFAHCIAAEIRFQNHALKRELASWEQMSCDHDSFKLHRSQISRICRTIDAARTAFGLDTLDFLAGSEDDILKRLRDSRGRIQSLHLLWNFFRHKLLQRSRPEFQRFLLAADDLAWACYRPFLHALSGSHDGRKEPPLTFLSMEPAPFAQSRQSSFTPAGLSTREQSRLYEFVRQLPVPIIGMPWLQAGHAPDLVFIGHETGHIVADDLGLAGEFDALLDAVACVPDDRRPHWRAWFDEVFADVFGVLALGAAYGNSLIRALAGDLVSIRREQPDARSEYPPRHVRVKLVGAAARALNLATDFLDTWAAVYPGLTCGFDDDIEPLVHGLLGYEFGQIGGQTVGQVLTPPDARAVDAYVESLLDNMALPRTGTFFIRAAIAGGARAHAQDVARWQRANADAALLTHIARQRDDGYRDPAIPTRLAIVRQDARIDAPQMRDADDRIGHDIAAILASEPRADEETA